MRVSLCFSSSSTVFFVLGEERENAWLGGREWKQCVYLLGGGRWQGISGGLLLVVVVGFFVQCVELWMDGLLLGWLARGIG
jgi:hypothetical protein